MKRIIYDVGSNNGDDIPYYLKKADAVVAVEANPLLCRQIEQRFPEEIRAGRLFVENCVVTTDDSLKDVFFYIHRTNDVLSQFPKPDSMVLAEFEEVLLPSRSILAIVEKHGAPYYIKLDIENYDEQILRALFEGNVRPMYVSAETYNIHAFSLMLTLGGYRSFNLVDAPHVSRTYMNHQIVVNGHKETYSFPHHSAGPFGEDILSQWMTPNNFFAFLALEGLGWKDIHATNQIEPNPLATHAKLSTYMFRAIRRRFRKAFGRFLPA